MLNPTLIEALNLIYVSARDLPHWEDKLLPLHTEEEKAYFRRLDKLREREGKKVEAARS